MPGAKNEAKVSFEDNPEDVAKREALSLAAQREEQSAFKVPREVVKLPSQGKIYPPTSNLHKAKEIEVRQMTAPEEDILTSRALIRSNRAIDLVISQCLTDKSVRIDDLLAGDKNAITVSLRISGYGAEYRIPISCPSCAEETDHTFDLSNLNLNMLDLETPGDGENRFSFDVPSGTKLEFKFLTSGEQKQITENQANVKRVTGTQVDKNVTTRLKKQILSVNGVSDNVTISKYVDSMTVRDSRALRKYIDDQEPDVIMKQDFECPSCGNRQEVDIPPTVEFFWPE